MRNAGVIEPGASPVTPEADTEPGNIHGLSPRQRQILELLRAGKVNKEIANELGIGLGTVKQHVVALFKKLHVSNRTMAVSRLPPPAETAPLSLTQDGFLENRPCMVMSFSLEEEAPNVVRHALHQSLAGRAYHDEAIYLARRNAGGDLIYGVQHIDEALPQRTVHAMVSILDEFCRQAADTERILHCGLTAGWAVASMHRHGGWTGEAIASITLSEARQLAQATRTGQVSLGEPIRELLDLEPHPDRAAPAAAIPFAAMAELLRPTPRPDTDALVGREEELARISDWIATVPQVQVPLVIAGETGMGKTTLCRRALALASVGGLSTRDLLCRNLGDGPIIHDLACGSAFPPDQLLHSLGDSGAVWVLDDCHLLSETLLATLVQEAVAHGVALLLSGRPTQELSRLPAAFVRLGRLSLEDTTRLVTHHIGIADSPQVEAIAVLAAGVPLFARELARERGALSLPLQLVIGGRMDRLKLDRQLLRQVARPPGAWSMLTLARSMGESLESVTLATDHALAAGVLKLNKNDQLTFSHPLLRQAVIHAEVESP